MSVKHATLYGAGPTKIGTQWDEAHTADNGEFYETGDWKFAGRKSVPTGWIASSTATIGNVGSGATYANAAALALFTLWWTEWTNAELPILTSAGAGSTRGASAVADWAALKRMSVLGTAGRFLRVPGTINGVTIVAGVQYADTFKDHNHSLSVVGEPGSGGAVGIRGSATTATGAPSTNLTTVGGGGGLETAPVSIGIPGFWKL